LGEESPPRTQGKKSVYLLVKDLRLLDHCYFFKLFRMTPKTYECLLSWVGPIIKKQETNTPPSTKEDWKKVSKTFEERWNFPHALGAIDGKHVVMQCPARGGSDYFNYQKAHSIVLFGICNGSYEFIMVDIGDAGRQSDGSVYSDSNLGFAIENNTLDFPRLERIKNSIEVFPYVFLGDDAFSLKT